MSPLKLVVQGAPLVATVDTAGGDGDGSRVVDARRLHDSVRTAPGVDGAGGSFHAPLAGRQS
jgi:hypothetical protein